MRERIHRRRRKERKMEEFVITNEADGLALFVFKPKNPKFAWGTKFVDTDANEVINVRLFNDYTKAVAYANDIMNVGA